MPGCSWTYYVYDEADRVIMAQDGVQHTNNKWTVSSYDKLGRLLYTSEIYDSSAKTADSWNTTLNDTLVTEETSSSGFGYTRNYFSSYPYKLLTVNYYDNYDFVTSSSLSYTENSDYGTKHSKSKGLLTGMRIYQLDDSTKYIITANYYDYRGLIIQIKATNHLGGTEAEYIAYDFLKHPTQKKHVHTSTQAGTVTELYTYTYDHAGRLTRTTHRLNEGTEQILSLNTYDKLGRMQTHKAGKSPIINTSYNYNVRSWTTSITGTHFVEALDYNYDGNISEQTFGESDADLTLYDFVYDNLSRLTDATSSSTNDYYGANDAYGFHCVYDKMGNPESIITNGLKATVGGSTSDILFDDLTLTYSGNQLRNVTDSGDTTTNTITEQFFDYADSTQEYTYNANGAMTQDLNKGISSISYNLLNLPSQVDILSPVGEARNTYVYAADGTKLQVVKQYNSNYNDSPIIGSAINTSNLDVTKTRDYVGNMIFEDDELDRILVDGGYIKDGTYYFYETDHLGDNRTVVNQSGIVVERNDYYPYGMQMAHYEFLNSASSDNKYKYNGKELDVMHGLNLYDYSARSQDPTLGRFTSVDPLAEKYYSISPYAYCAGNPILNVDIDGREKLAYFHLVDLTLNYGAKNFPDDNNIYIFAHANYHQMRLEDFKGYYNVKVTDAKGFKILLDNDSKTWVDNNKSGEAQTIVLFGCNLANNSKGKPLAQIISEDPLFKDVTIVTPSTKISMWITGEYDGVCDDNGVMGNWIIYKNGVVLFTIPGDQMPTEKNIKYFSQMNNQKSYPNYVQNYNQDDNQVQYNDSYFHESWTDAMNRIQSWMTQNPNITLTVQ